MEKVLGSFWNFIEKILHFIFVKILHIKTEKETWEKFLQFVKFGLVEVSNSVVSYGIYIISLLIFQNAEIFKHNDYLIAQFIGFLLSVLWSFYWNKKFVFEVDDKDVSWVRMLLKTYASYAFTGIFLNTILSILWVQYLEISKVVAPIINLLINVPLNFILNKFWAFKK